MIGATRREAPTPTRITVAKCTVEMSDGTTQVLFLSRIIRDFPALLLDLIAEHRS